MPMVRAMRLLNAVEAGTTTGSQLDALLLADPGRLSDWATLLVLPGQCTRMAASSTAMTAVAASSTAKMACFNSDTALNAIAASSTAMAACRAAAQYNVQSWSENNTTAVTISLIGTSYIVLGASRSAAAVRTDTFTTLRSGSAISLTTANTAGASSTTATDFNCAIPLVAPYTAKLNNTGTVTGYIGLLRCDI